MNIGAALAAVALHLVVLAILIALSVEDVEVSSTPPAAQKIDRGDRLVEATIATEKKEAANQPGGQSDCSATEDFYYGVGILSITGTGIIVQAPPTYPAYRAGVRVGDQLVEFHNVPGSEGIVYLTIIRDGAVKKFRMQKENICFTRPEKPAGD